MAYNLKCSNLVNILVGVVIVDIKNFCGLNNRQQLKTLLNDAKWLLMLISSLYLSVLLVRWGLSKNGDNNLKGDRKRELSPKK